MSAPSLANCHLRGSRDISRTVQEQHEVLIRRLCVCACVCVPQEAVGRSDVILQLEVRAPADGHAVVVLNPHRVLNVVRLRHRTSVINLQTERPDMQHVKIISLCLSRTRTHAAVSSHHGSAARVSVRVSQGSPVHHRQLLWVDVSAQNFLPVTYKHRNPDFTRRHSHTDTNGKR